MFTRSNIGFTLIELLVVISIISLLSSVVLSSLNSARESGRDSQRLVQLRETEKALALYALDHDGNYPEEQRTTGLVTWYDINTIPINYWDSKVTTYLVNQGYLGAVPKDPLNKNATLPYRYTFQYFSMGPDYNIPGVLRCGTESISKFSYVILFSLERDNQDFARETGQGYSEYCFTGPRR